jgi:hypothetical protein
VWFCHFIWLLTVSSGSFCGVFCMTSQTNLKCLAHVGLISTSILQIYSFDWPFSIFDKRRVACRRNLNYTRKKKQKGEVKTTFYLNALLLIFFFCVFGSFWWTDIKIIFLKNKNIILVHFRAKNSLKRNCYHTSKHPLSLPCR